MRYLFGFLYVCALGVMPLVGCSSGGTAIPCEGDDECPNDNNACTVANCDEGFCTYDPIECDADVSDCTVEMCDPAVGCEQSPVADGTRCAGGTCQAGVCELAGSVLPCSEQGIRNAIAAGGDEPYTFDCDGTTPVVIEGVIVVDNNVILDGEGNLTVTDSSFNPIVVVEEEVTAELRGFTIIGGAPLPLPSEKIGMLPPGSGILNNGTLTLTHSTVSNKPGSGISNGGTLTMTNCTVSGNLIGGIANGGTLTMTNSTVSGNTGVAGGILNNGTLTMTNSTLSGNMSNEPEDERSAIVNGEDATLTVANNLVDGDCSNDGVITSNGYNIESPGNTCGFDQASDLVERSTGELSLGELADNGGPTQTHALLPGSVAVDNVPEAACVDADGARLTGDQRGVTRPQGPACDSGAFELEETTATVTGTVTFAGSGAPADAATVSVFGASVSTVTDAQGQFTLDVPVGSVFFQISKEGTWGQIELETVLSTRDVRFELVEDSLVEEVEQSLMIEFPETQGVIDVIFNSPSGLGGETAMLSVPSDSSLTFDAAEQPVLSEELVAGGGEDLVFVGVDLTEELIVSPMGVAGVNTCELENPGTVYPVLAKSFTRVRQVQCTALP